MEDVENIVGLLKESSRMRFMGGAMEAVLSSADPGLFGRLLAAAKKTGWLFGEMRSMCGADRIQQQCRRDCLYCGLRVSNRSLERYHLQAEEIIELGLAIYRAGITSIALQAGENSSDREVERIAGVVSELREKSMQERPPGLGVTLSLGEMTYRQYKRLYDAGAHRYLLRIESSDVQVFKRIHPPRQVYERRLEYCIT